MAAPAEDAAADAVDQLSLEYNPSNRLGFYQKRIALFEQFYEREQQRVEEARKAAVPIKVVLPDGAIKEAIKGATTPLDVANEISKSLGKKVLVAKVDGEVWDAFRPLEADCALQLLTWDEPDGKEVSLDALKALRHRSRQWRKAFV
jgi:threonyl-tRNA synthetase